MWETLFTGGAPQTGVITIIATCAIVLIIAVVRSIRG